MNGYVNNDGYDDFIVGSTGYDRNGNTDSTGGAFVVFGGPTLRSTINVTELDGNNGFIIAGIKPGDSLGSSVEPAGDVNGDNIDDLLIGATGALVDENRNSSGAIYVVFGRERFQARFNLSELGGTNGFLITSSGLQGGGIGLGISSAGDMNRDGLDDLILGAPDIAPTGEAYVIYGQDRFPASIDLLRLDGTNGFRAIASNNAQRAGYDVSGLGDVNGDGSDDVIVISQFGAVESYIIFGKPDIPALLDLSELDGTNGVIVTRSDGFQNIVNSAGDINSDGFNDVVLGDFSSRSGAPGGGESFLIFGRSSFESRIDSDVFDGTRGVRFPSKIQSDTSGRCVDSAGDINQDGISDLIIGAIARRQSPPFPPRTGIGHAYLIFGQPSFDSPTLVSSMGPQTGFRIEGIESNSNFGIDVSGLGDINGDGSGDFSIHSFNDSYVVFGRIDFIGDATPNNPTCGEPRLDNTIDQGIFLWQDCPNDSPSGEWHILATAGGSDKTVRYDGVIESTSLATKPVRFESSDILQHDTTSEAFVMRVLGSWADGMDFTTEVGAPVCSDIALNNRNAPVYVGASRKRLNTKTPVDLTTGDQCILSPKLTTCGRPTFSGSAGLYVWQDCGTDAWRLFRTAINIDLMARLKLTSTSLVFDLYVLKNMIHWMYCLQASSATI